jgi:hypothetical protein
MLMASLVRCRETIRSALLEENGAFCILNHGIPL